jgi:hypothetical protein
VTALFDPAAAIAAGRCVTARAIDEHGRTSMHDRECGWCDYPLPVLVEMVATFNEWAGFDMRSNSYARHEVRAFVDLPREEQQRRIVVAQSFAEPTPSPTPSPEPVPADEESDEWALL